MTTTDHAPASASLVAGWTSKLDRLTADESRTWGIGRRTLLLALVLPVIGAIGVAATVVNRPLYRWITREDGPLEWAQFSADIAAVVGATLVTVLLYRRGLRWPVVLWAIFALSQVFIAGEEISWGQRVLGHATPEPLRELNHQEETNIHNIRPIQDSINVVFMLVGAYGSVGVLALRSRIRRADRPAWFDLFVPPLALFSLFGLVFAYKLSRLMLFQSPRFVVVKYGEYFELCTGVALAAFAWLSYRRLRGEASNTAAQG